MSAAAISKLSLAAAATTVTAGQTDNLTITALDAYGNTATSYTGSHTLTFAGAGTAGATNPTVSNAAGAQVNFGSNTAITFASGVATVSGSTNGVMRLYKVETANITVAEGGSYTSGALAITVSAAAISKLSLAAAATTVTAGQTDNLTITALDAYGNTATSYTGSHTLTFAGAGTAGATNPTVSNAAGAQVNFGSNTAITFASGVATVSGSTNGVMRLYKVETANITVAEGGSYTSGALAITVSAAAISKLSLAAAATTVTAGQTDNLTITALDAYGNTATSYTGSHTLTFAGAGTAGATNPTVSNAAGAQVNFGSNTAITFASGVATVSGSTNGVMRLYKVETANITVAEGGSYTSGALAITVTGGYSLKVQYRNYDGATTDNQIKPGLQLENTGSSSITLSRVTIRYWFTRDGGATTFSTWCDYAAIGCGNVTESVVAVSPSRSGADSYLQVGFTSGAASLAAGASAGDMQTAVQQDRLVELQRGERLLLRHGQQLRRLHESHRLCGRRPRVGHRTLARPRTAIRTHRASRGWTAESRRSWLRDGPCRSRQHRATPDGPPDARLRAVARRLRPTDGLQGGDLRVADRGVAGHSAGRRGGQGADRGRAWRRAAGGRRAQGHPPGAGTPYHRSRQRVRADDRRGLPSTQVRAGRSDRSGQAARARRAQSGPEASARISRGPATAVGRRAAGIAQAPGRPPRVRVATGAGHGGRLRATRGLGTSDRRGEGIR